MTRLEVRYRDLKTGNQGLGKTDVGMEIINKRNELGSLIGAKLWRTTKTNMVFETNLTEKKTLPNSNVQRIR